MRRNNKKVLKQTTKLQLWVNKEIYSKLKELSIKQGRSISDIVREGIAKILINYDQLFNNEENTE